MAMALTVGMGLQPLNVEATAEHYNGYAFSPRVNYDDVVTQLEVSAEKNDSIVLYKSRGGNDKPYWCGRKEHTHHRQR